jgi:hypothetical protein
MKRAYKNRDEILTLNPETDYLRIYQLTTLYDFPTDARLGLNLAFYRIFAIPHMAELLVKTGEMTDRPTKRAYDTGLVMYELISSGFDDPRGREMVRLLNRVHRPWPISNEDYQYVLAAFIVVPSRWIDKRGWRPLLPAEKEASATFYLELARLMNIRDPPVSYRAAEEMLDSYEQEHMAPSADGKVLMNKTQEVVVRKLPGRLKQLGPGLTSALLSEPKLGDALGLPPANHVFTILIDTFFKTRNLKRRLENATDQSWFVRGRPVSTLYPGGYELNQLGPTRD